MRSCAPFRGKRGKFWLVAMSLGAAMALSPRQVHAYAQFNLVSDIPGLAPVTDPNLVNPWGMSSSSSSPIWVSDNGADVSTLYTGTGQQFPIGNPLVVKIPNGAPTGQVFTGNLPSFGSVRFAFASEAGTISSWSGGTSAVAQFTSSTAVYKGLALGVSGVNTQLYATDFHNNRIDVFSNTFGQVSLGAGAFTDPTLPTGYAPFGIQNINGKLYVSYALQDGSAHDDVAGPGNGFVDVYNTDGSLVGRLISNGPLNSPWGLALAPSNFGQFSGDLLVGNFGDGTINAFDPTTGAFLGTLDDPNGNPIVIEGLWGLLFGNGGNGGATDQLFFSAGIPGPDHIEDHGLFGDITVPEPSTLAIMLASGLVLLGVRRRRA
jgi:uncharacterized protein (TIGR03118 family)